MPRLGGETELHVELRGIQDDQSAGADELNKGHGKWAAEIECD